MKNLLYRLKYAVEEELQQLNQWTTKETPADENPVALLNRYLKEAEVQTESISQLIIRQQELVQQFETEEAENKAMFEKRQNQLQLAEQTTEEDLITFAQMEVAAYEHRLQTIHTHLQDAKKELIRLEYKFEQMKHQLKDMKLRQLQLMGKENTLRANHQMDELLTKKETNSSLSADEFLQNLAQTEVEILPKQVSMEMRLEQLK